VPTDFSERCITIDDLDLGPLHFDAWQAGPRDGELVLLLHGFPETKRSFRHQVGALADAGYHAVAFDQRGYSPGARPARVEDYDLRLISRDVLAVADALGAERFRLVGHDYGGPRAGARERARHDRPCRRSLHLRGARRHRPLDP
jgi:pimeloyl-ACP methyl ester carboxylesterase